MTYFLSSFFVLLLTVGVNGFSGGSDVEKIRTGKNLLRGNDGSPSNSVLTVQKDDRTLQKDDQGEPTVAESIPFCNFGPSGTGDTSTCERGPASDDLCNGDWCDGSEDNCESSGGRWCIEEGPVEPWVAAAMGQDQGQESTNDFQEYDTDKVVDEETFCSFGPDGTGDTSTCEGGPASGNRCNGDVCNDSVDNCESSGGRWCVGEGPVEPWAAAAMGLGQGQDLTNDFQEFYTDKVADEETAAFCNFGPDGTGDTSTCELGPAGGDLCNGDWCNDSQGNCESSGGRWCTGEGPVEPWAAAIIGLDQGQELTNDLQQNDTDKVADEETAAFCNFGHDGTGDTSTCEEGPASGNRCNGVWCNDNQVNCESSGGRWCIGEGPVDPLPVALP